jgi:UDP-N-acetylglucosamine 4,6-dehydratase
MTDTRICITGGTGTFGTACLTELLTRDTVRRVVIFSRDELKQSEMRRQFRDPRVEWFIGDVRDREALDDAFAVGIDLVIHAAALKQVGTGEQFPREVHKTNVDGAVNVIAAARAAGVRRVVALSTDKAVAPINVYGKSKAAAEALFIAANHAAARAGQRTTFVAVRYGNVIGSRGSVVPLFIAQRDTGVLRVTDLRASRFWMPISQAVTSVLWAAAHPPAGSIVVPKIPSALVADLARAVAPACRIQETGLTPGEKLHEELIAPDEARRTFYVGQYCVIAPETSTPEGRLWWVCNAERVPAGFAYRSDLDPQRVQLLEEASCASA